MAEKIKADLVVLGGGPGGYTAAFRAADLGLSVTLVDKNETLGGVCLNVGCIPSKTLLHAAFVMEEAEAASKTGIIFSPPEIDLDALRENKNSVIRKLTSGLDHLCSERKIRVIKGTGKFKNSKTITVEGNSEVSEIAFDKIIIAAGSEPVSLSLFPDNDSRIWDSTDALELKEIPERLLVVGGGIIGLEMATVYSTLGSSVTIVEAMDQIIPASDPDMVKPLYRKLKKKLKNIMLETSVTGVGTEGKAVTVIMKDRKNREISGEFDIILVAVGRKPNTGSIDAEKGGLTSDSRGFIQVNEKMETSVEGIYAIGDITGNPMLAHKASHQGKIAAESAAGLKSAFTPATIPSVAYTNPEVAWAGMTEKEAEAASIKYKVGVFPWSASGRALTSGASSGFTKLLFDSETGRIIGAGITGLNAGELISEAVLAIEMGADAEDIGSTIHPHPSLSETTAFASEIVSGSITDILQQK